MNHIILTGSCGNCGREIPLDINMRAKNFSIEITIPICKDCKDQIWEDARDEGYSEGYDEGEEKGYEEGFAEGKEDKGEPTDEHGRVIKEPIEIQYEDSNYTGA